MNTQETNSPLDLPETTPTNTKREWRPYFLAIESVLLILVFLFVNLLEILPMAGSIFMLLTLGLIIFNFVVPIIKLARKEIKIGLFILYLLQGFVIVMCLMGILFKIQSWPYASEFLTVGIMSMCLFLILIPNVEIRKYKAKGEIHLLVTLIGLAMIIGYMGILFNIESYPYANELITAALMLIIPILGWMISKIWRSKEHFYLKYYLPRLALIIFFMVNYSIS